MAQSRLADPDGSGRQCLPKLLGGAVTLRPHIADRQRSCNAPWKLGAVVKLKRTKVTGSKVNWQSGEASGSVFFPGLRWSAKVVLGTEYGVLHMRLRSAAESTSVCRQER